MVGDWVGAACQSLVQKKSRFFLKEKTGFFSELGVVCKRAHLFIKTIGISQ
jgi:hypothetical protein